MTSSAKKSLAKHAFKSFAIGLTLFPLLAAAQAQKAAAPTPSLAGPSLVESSRGALFTGNGYKPNSAVSVSLRSPSGVESHVSTVVAADGSISYRVDSPLPGTYGLKVLDSGGKALSSTEFHVVR
ncbi:hypothetical protein LNV09_03350 [Paucibacter sp. B2R-40]|uniref:hypothetical protein n=1 Tax=Paucibacter sp. B2R-40 TaxID=2893554 RepID=UPI0021E4181A|nr:hypothetical protein [Paucibacter sp. B2R-40]MCV2353191.1 hypothetical protein [Paucibacter sp. B2R-40]